MLLRYLAGVKRLNEVDGEVVRGSSVNVVRHCEGQVVRTRDEQCLHDVLHQAIVLYSATAFDFKEGSVAVDCRIDSVGVDSIERLTVLSI